MTKALALAEEQAFAQLAELDLTPAGFKDNVIKSEDMPRQPRLRVAQNKNTELGIEAGTLYNDVSGQAYGNAVEVIFLGWFIDTRVMWPIEYHKDNDPECASNDAITPAESTDQRPLTNPQNGPCASCPSAEWGPNGEAPRCSRQRNCALWIVKDEEPVQLTVQKSGMPPAQRLTVLSETCNVQNSIWVTQKYEDNEKGQYYILLFSKSGKEGIKIKPTLSLQLHALGQSLVKLNKLEGQADTTQDGGNGYTPDPDADIVEGQASTPDDDDEMPF